MKMKLWLFERIGPCDYDQHDAVLITAMTKRGAMFMLHPQLRDEVLSDFMVTRLRPKDLTSKVVIASFRAG